MANEIQLAASLTATKNSAAINSGAQTKLVTMAGVNLYEGTQNCAVTNSPITFGSISGVPSALLIKNMDNTNFVVISQEPACANNFVKLLAGEVCLFPPGIAGLYWKGSGVCTCWVCATEA